MAAAGLMFLGCDDASAPSQNQSADADAAFVLVASDATTLKPSVIDANTVPLATDAQVPVAMESCVAQDPPLSEKCNGRDEDCDGRVDENVTRRCFDGPPGTQATGTCMDGVQTCRDGVWGGCEGQALPSEEMCDGRDEDCDGRIDELVPTTAVACGVGACAAVGEQQCVDGAMSVIQCQPGEPGLEGCDGIDNDCDGVSDEDVADEAILCGLGECQRPGVRRCMVGEWLNVCTIGPITDEICDGLDNDCDDRTDEELDESFAIECGIGLCARMGMARCVGGAQVDENCIPGLPSPEICDGEDNDCDGEIDEDVVNDLDGDDLGCDDADRDGDGLDDDQDNCPEIFNPNQADVDQDGSGDACDEDAIVYIDARVDVPDPDGTQGKPFSTITQGLTAASARGRAFVYVAVGRYEGQVRLVDGISVFGGFDPVQDWSRRTSERTKIIVNAQGDEDVIAVWAQEILEGAALDGLEIEARAASGNGTSVYGILAQNAPRLSIRSLTVSTGSGAPGSDGRNGEAGVDGMAGGRGGDCGDTPGVGGESPCESDGYRGGAGSGHRVRGLNGEPEMCGGDGGDHGEIGAGDDGRPGCRGLAGTDGADGEVLVSASIVEGRWTPGRGQDGQSGLAGNGGGGGGGGGGAAVVGVVNDRLRGGGGGGGGGGGCGGSQGTGAGQGGGSFGLFFSASPGASIRWSRIVAGNGGPGGAGGVGGQGGLGGSGGSGGEGGDFVACGGVAGPGDGGPGGSGGNGGRGGHGQGGAGGPSYAVYCHASLIELIDSELIHADPSFGGASPGNTGPAGDSRATVDCALEP